MLRNFDFSNADQPTSRPVGGTSDLALLLVQGLT
jgi:hypothetical protein